MAVVVRLAGAVRNKRDARPVGRPLRIGVVPILPLRDLFCLSTRHANDPQMPPLVIKPSGVVEFVLDMRVMPDIALAIGGGHAIHRPGRADNHDARSLPRPLVALYSILQLRKSYGLAPASDGEQINLRLCCFPSGKVRRARGKKRQRFPVGTPPRRVRAEALRTQSTRRRRTVDGNNPDRRFAPVLLLVDAGDNIRDHFAVGRNVRIAHEFEREIVLRCDAALGLRARCLRPEAAKAQKANHGEQRRKFFHCVADSSIRIDEHKRLRP